ncbi:MAG: hypothetical protein IJ733_19880 [Lachnospiraceae bacterium]|nr:hypothetical protein [Lachnospiraceae bacterium]
MFGKKNKKKEKNSLRLSDKKHPVSAIVATGIGVVSLLLFIIICVISSESDGNAGVLIGAGGIFCFLLSVTGFVMAWMSLHIENIRPQFPTAAAVLNGLLMVFYFLLYMWGMFV